MTLTNRITRYENATSALGNQVPAPALIDLGQMQPNTQGALALQIIAMQKAYEQAMQAVRDEARELVARQLQSSLN